MQLAASVYFRVSYDGYSIHLHTRQNERGFRKNFSTTRPLAAELLKNEKSRSSTTELLKSLSSQHVPK